ncbi:hypothetical protein FJW04_05965 [Mesorhizobium sp. B2-7-3]|uniref:hypothetical protein n=1 Tax=Mesorhizobium sp. B2-7-3 TaxID=2589907 RepID=UPI00112B148B|nr:hypothetical protein [Mesorhizobium sp. B2-7-3]TPJ18860.1 hypothetical protein FJW04_05965 [Mesorhizobium sp. B2-7-3]
MSTFYSSEVLRFEDPVTHKPEFSPTELSKMLGKDRKNFGEKWGKERLTKAMRDAIEDTLPSIHDDTPLHSYSWRLFFNLRSLRETETRARARVKSASTSQSVEKIIRAYELGVREVVASFVTSIGKASSLINDENGGSSLSRDDLTEIYLAGAVLHTALIVWEDAADALTALKKRVPLDFELLELEDFVNVVDVAEKSHALYGAAEFELRQLAKKNRKLCAPALKEAAQMGDGIVPDGIVLELREKEAREAQLAQQDAEIVAIQMASIASHAVDWQRATPDYRAIMGISENVAERLTRLANSAPAALRNGVTLLDRLPKNQLLARNIAYQAVQCDDGQTMRRAAEIIARQKEIEISAVWRTEIMARRPLCEEIHLATRFENGSPKLLNRDGETK